MTDLLSRLFLQIEPRSGSSDHYHLFTGRKHVLSPHDELYTLTILTFALIVPPCPPAFQFKLFASAASFFLLSSRNHSHTSASSVAFTSSHLTLPGGCQLSSLTRPLLLLPAPAYITMTMMLHQSKRRNALRRPFTNTYQDDDSYHTILFNYNPSALKGSFW